MLDDNRVSLIPTYLGTYEFDGVKIHAMGWCLEDYKSKLVDTNINQNNVLNVFQLWGFLTKMTSKVIYSSFFLPKELSKEEIDLIFEKDVYRDDVASTNLSSMEGELAVLIDTVIYKKLRGRERDGFVAYCSNAILTEKLGKDRANELILDNMGGARKYYSMLTKLDRRRYSYLLEMETTFSIALGGRSLDTIRDMFGGRLREIEQGISYKLNDPIHNLIN